MKRLALLAVLSFCNCAYLGHSGYVNDITLTPPPGQPVQVTDS